MFKTVRADLHAFTKNGSFASKVKCLIISHAFHLVLMIRFGQFVSKVPVFGSILRLITEYAIRVVFASDISLRAKNWWRVMHNAWK